MSFFSKEHYEEQDKELDAARAEADLSDIQQDALAAQLREGETNLVREQLSLNDELETIEQLLRGRILKDGQWIEPTNKSMVILTDHGVHLIMNTILFYMNKNTLLSNYTEELINKKMEDFSTALADSLFMESDKAFVQPTNKDAVDEYQSQLTKKVDNEFVIAEIKGLKLTKENIRQDFIDSVDVAKTIGSIKEQMKKDKLKRFELLIRVVQDAIHSTYLRAWNGQERRTLRQHITISETTSPTPPPQRRSHKPQLNFFRR